MPGSVKNKITINKNNINVILSIPQTVHSGIQQHQVKDWVLHFRNQQNYLKPEWKRHSQMRRFRSLPAPYFYTIGNPGSSHKVLFGPFTPTSWFWPYLPLSVMKDISVTHHVWEGNVPARRGHTLTLLLPRCHPTLHSSSASSWANAV